MKTEFVPNHITHSFKRNSSPPPAYVMDVSNNGELVRTIPKQIPKSVHPIEKSIIDIYA